MHANEALIYKFYEAFQKKQGEAMAACYHPDIQFSDPVFPDLKGSSAGAMWRMLTEKAADLEITFSNIKADENSGSARWEAVYSFGKENRKVHNRISAQFEFRDGQIVKHTDRFNLWRWAIMALGVRGIFLGWSPMVKNAVRAESAKGLLMYMKRKRIEPTA